jgi:c-di-GMP-binding flagellar brake protein YcgR
MDTKGKEDRPRFGIVNFERRKNPRFSIDLPIEYYRTESSIAISSRTGNLSEGGLLVYLSERVEVGQHLDLKLFFAPVSESMQTMEALAEVVWVNLENLETSGLLASYRCGLKFIDVNPMDMEKLKAFLKSLA